GTGNIPSFTATNPTSAPLIAQITVTPIANNCEGIPQVFSITVNPTPAVTEISDIIICDKGAVTGIEFTGSDVAGTIYKWTNNNTGVGLAANGTGNINAFTATNNTSAPINATITVIPVANGCEGTSKTFSIRVNPTSTLTK